MSGQENQPAPKPEENPPEEAVFRPSRWPGLIWAVPIAAVGIIGWLGINALLQSGPSVTVMFPVTGGLQPGNTKVEYNGFVVGHVGDVSLTKSLGQMRVDINFIAAMQGHLGSGTQYWLAGTTLSLADISNLKDIISGPVVQIDPHSGKTVHHAQGLGKPPVLKNEGPGLTVTLTTTTLGNVSAGSPVMYKGYKIGKVRGLELLPDGSAFRIYAFIPNRWRKLISTNTRFWNAGDVQLTSSGGVRIESVPSLIMGAIAFETPGGPGNAPATAGEHYTLYDSEQDARDAPGPDAVPYKTIFPGGPHGLVKGAEVQLEGAPAGGVTKVTESYDPASGALQTEVDFVLQPQRIGMGGAGWNLADPAPQMNAMLARLVGQGLRAEMGSAMPVVGPKIIKLERVKGQPEASLQPGQPPAIPSFGSGGGMDDIISQVNDILATVNAMPLDQIAANVHEATRQIAALARSPKTKRTLRRLDETVRHVDDITRRTDAQLPSILAQVKQSAAEAQAALAETQSMLSTQGGGNAGPESGDLPHALYELTQAARSLQALADFLTSHPGALIAGRGD